MKTWYIISYCFHSVMFYIDIFFKWCVSLHCFWVLWDGLSSWCTWVCLTLYLLFTKHLPWNIIFSILYLIGWENWHSLIVLPLSAWVHWKADVKDWWEEEMPRNARIEPPAWAQNCTERKWTTCIYCTFVYDTTKRLSSVVVVFFLLSCLVFVPWAGAKDYLLSWMQLWPKWSSRFAFGPVWTGLLWGTSDETSMCWHTNVGQH